MPPVSHPYDGAREAIGGMGQTFNNVAINIARIRYQRAMNEQRMAMAQAQLALKQQMQQQQAEHMRAQIQEYIANARNHNSSADLTQAKLANAETVGQGMQSRYMADQAAQGAAQAPDIGPPTPEEQATQNMGSLYGQLAKSTALSGKANTLLLPQDLAPNHIKTSPLDGSLAAQGPVLLNPDQKYELQGQAPQYGKPKPVVDNTNKSSAVDAAIIRGAIDGGYDTYPTGRRGAPPDPAQVLNYNAYTNILGRAQSPQLGAPAPAPVVPSQAGPVAPPAAASQTLSTPEEFGSEDEARAAGKKKGDFIYIRGVGKGYLN